MFITHQRGENYMGKIYNAVYSVKGGCGKTAFSILLSYYLSEKSVRKEKVCLVDTDIMGSSMLNAFTPFSTVEELPEYISKYKFINEIVNVEKLDNISEFFVNTGELEEFFDKNKSSLTIENEEIVNRIGFDVIFCSPKSGDINKFRIGEDGGFDTDILHQMFKSCFCGFINKKMHDKPNIIFDMPPGSDGFSNVVFNSIFKNSNANEKNDYIGTEDDIRNLFFIINLDYGHIATVLRELKIFAQESKMKFPDNIFIVLNDTTSVDDSQFNTYTKDRYELFVEKIKEMKLKLSQREYNSIHFIFIKFNPKYSDAMCNGTGLLNAHLSAVFEDIVNIGPPEMHSELKKNAGDDGGDKDAKGVVIFAYGLPHSSEAGGSELYDIMTKKR